MRSGALACLLPLADSLPGRLQERAGEVGGQGEGALICKPKTEMKDRPIRYQTSSNIDVDSGSYVTVVLKESSSFCDFLLAVPFHNKNLELYVELVQVQMIVVTRSKYLAVVLLNNLSLFLKLDLLRLPKFS
jgi:hypothetical protein